MFSKHSMFYCQCLFFIFDQVTAAAIFMNSRDSSQELWMCYSWNIYNTHPFINQRISGFLYWGTGKWQEKIAWPGEAKTKAFVYFGTQFNLLIVLKLLLHKIHKFILRDDTGQKKAWQQTHKLNSQLACALTLVSYTVSHISCTPKNILVDCSYDPLINNLTTMVGLVIFISTNNERCRFYYLLMYHRTPLHVPFFMT